MTNITNGLTLPSVTKKPLTFFGQKWPFQEVNICNFNHATICPSQQSVFKNVRAKIPLRKPPTVDTRLVRALTPPIPLKNKSL